jgi:hypothetical protein
MGNRISISPLASYYANNPSSNQITAHDLGNEKEQSPFARAIEIAATQTKSACADWVITGVAFPGFGIIGLWFSCYW